MTKQDVYDIVYLLEPLFDSIGKEVRKELNFEFIEDDIGPLKYDDEELFQGYDKDDNPYQMESIKSNLKIRYNNPFHIKPIYGSETAVYGSREITNIEDFLDKDIKNANFHMKAFKYLSQEFKIVYISSDDSDMEFTIQDTEKITKESMKWVKKFENFDNSDEIKKYLEDNYSEDWFNNQLDERAPDYTDSDWEEDGYESESDWYMNHACGGAIEYDLLDEINKDLQRRFNLSWDQADPYVEEVFNKNCHWKDPFCFRDKRDDNKDIENLMNKLK